MCRARPGDKCYQLTASIQLILMLTPGLTGGGGPPCVPDRHTDNISRPLRDLKRSMCENVSVKAKVVQVLVGRYRLKPGTWRHASGCFSFTTRFLQTEEALSGSFGPVVWSTGQALQRFRASQNCELPLCPGNNQRNSNWKVCSWRKVGLRETFWLAFSVA